MRSLRVEDTKQLRQTRIHPPSCQSSLTMFDSVWSAVTSFSTTERRQFDGKNSFNTPEAFGLQPGSLQRTQTQSKGYQSFCVYSCMCIIYIYMCVCVTCVCVCVFFLSSAFCCSSRWFSDRLRPFSSDDAFLAVAGLLSSLSGLSYQVTESRSG